MTARNVSALLDSAIVLEGIANERRSKLSPKERSLLASFQDAELFLLSAPTTAALVGQVDNLLGFARRISRAELADLAAELEKSLSRSEVRAAVIASTPADLADRLATLKSWLASGITAITFQDKPLTNGVKYFYKVTAVNGNTVYTPPLPSENSVAISFAKAKATSSPAPRD